MKFGSASSAFRFGLTFKSVPLLTWVVEMVVLFLGFSKNIRALHESLVDTASMLIGAIL